MASLEAAGIQPIDLVVCNLYPFRVGGRAARRRRGRGDREHRHRRPDDGAGGREELPLVAVVTEPDRYGFVLGELRGRRRRALARHPPRPGRRGLRARRLATTRRSRPGSPTPSRFPDRLTIDLVKVGDLAYGENPHQRAAFYREAGARRHVLSRVDQVSGKPLSFNNLADLQAARDDRDRVPAPGLRDHQAREPVRRRGRRDDRRGLRARARGRPAVGVRRP